MSVERKKLRGSEKRGMKSLWRKCRDEVWMEEVKMEEDVRGERQRREES